MMLLKALKRLTCALSLALVAATALGSEVTDFRDAVASARNRVELAALLKSPPESIKNDGSLGYYFNYSIDVVETESRGNWNEIKIWVVEELDAFIALQAEPASGRVEDPKKAAEEILANPLYVDRIERKDRNWLDKVSNRLGDRIIAWLSQIEFSSPRTQFGLFDGALGGLHVIAWVLVLVVIGLVLYFVLRNFSGAARRKRRIGGILADDEPERTADQWLAQAEKLEAEGRFREAVRCLYIACLVRYDDGRVARFRRHETNWEHLYRIEGSPTNPKEVDFRAATQSFDKVWYGYMVRGVEDVTAFKEVYQKLCNALQIKSAA
jgi:hypothetical protein